MHRCVLLTALIIVLFQHAMRILIENDDHHPSAEVRSCHHLKSGSLALLWRNWSLWEIPSQRWHAGGETRQDTLHTLLNNLRAATNRTRPYASVNPELEIVNVAEIGSLIKLWRVLAAGLLRFH